MRCFRIDKVRPKRSPRQPPSNLNSTVNSPTLQGNVFSSDYLDAFEGPLSAFRGYSFGGTVYAPPALMEGSDNEAQSQIVIPSRLMLDGSSIAGYSTTDNKFPTSKEGTAQVDIRPQNETSPRESVISLESLSKRLKRSGSYLRHVHSVLRLSSTNSWRSSMSFMSMLSFGEEQLQPENSPNLVSNQAPSTPGISQQISDLASHTETAPTSILAKLETFVARESDRDNSLNRTRSRTSTLR